MRTKPVLRANGAVLLVLLVLACSPPITPGASDALAALPRDSGGTQTAFPRLLASDGLGFYAYLPGGYAQVSAPYPLLIYLHGSGESGDSFTTPSDLAKVLVHGPPKLIKAKKWNPIYPMIVISPQSGGWWNSQQIHDLITKVIATYRVDTSRIYMTGLSMGGYGTYSYLTSMKSKSYVAAAVPIAGQGTTSLAGNITVPLWAFHGDADTTVTLGPDLDMVAAINLTGPRVPAKITVYPGVGHDSWTRTYDGTGQGTESSAYDPFLQDIYSWMFRYTR